MNKILWLPVLLLGFLWSCESELVTPGDEYQIPLPKGTFTVEIDGVFTDFSETNSAISNEALTQINGANTEGQTISLNIPSAIAEGTFNQGIGTTIMMVLGADGTFMNIGENGQLTSLIVNITDVNMADKVVSGTFSGTVFNLVTLETYTLTNGVFVEIDFTVEEGGDEILKGVFNEVPLDFSSNAQAEGLLSSAVISGENVDQVQTLNITVPDGLSVGTFTELNNVVITVNMGTSENPLDYYTNYDETTDTYLPVALTISEITQDVDGRVIGTFSGTITKFTNGVPGEEITITNGEIDVPISVP